MSLIILRETRFVVSCNSMMKNLTLEGPIIFLLEGPISPKRRKAVSSCYLGFFPRNVRFHKNLSNENVNLKFISIKIFL
jgi:hypothetical protein